MSGKRSYAFTVATAPWGALPGILLALYVDFRAGVSCAVLGAFLAAILALPGVRLGRSLRLLFAVLVDHNVPLVDTDRLLRRATEASTTSEDVASASPVEDLFLRFLSASGTPPKSRRLVVIMLLLGWATGLAISAFDFRAIAAGYSGLLLPLSKDAGPDSEPAVVSMVMSVCLAVWLASAAAVLFDPIYRRRFIVFLGGTCFFTVAIDFAKGGGWFFTAFFGSIVAAFVLLFTTLEEAEIQESATGTRRQPGCPGWLIASVIAAIIYVSHYGLAEIHGMHRDPDPNSLNSEQL